MQDYSRIYIIMLFMNYMHAYGHLLYAGECPPGHIYNSTTESCDPCMLGYFKADRGPGKCAPCPSGMFTRSRGATECDCE